MFGPGDHIKVSGTSVGKGFAGTIKRHHFRRGPETHGSDSHREPGSIGAGTTPGRVYRGTRMAGRMGNDRVTVKKDMPQGRAISDADRATIQLTIDMTRNVQVRAGLVEALSARIGTPHTVELVATIGAYNLSKAADLQLARNAGVASVAVSFGAHDPGSFGAFDPLLVAHSVPELHQWLMTHA